MDILSRKKVVQACTHWLLRDQANTQLLYKAVNLEHESTQTRKP